MWLCQRWWPGTSNGKEEKMSKSEYIHVGTKQFRSWGQCCRVCADSCVPCARRPHSIFYTKDLRYMAAKTKQNCHSSIAETKLLLVDHPKSVSHISRNNRSWPLWIAKHGCSAAMNNQKLHTDPLSSLSVHVPTFCEFDITSQSFQHLLILISFYVSIILRIWSILSLVTLDKHSIRMNSMWVNPTRRWRIRTTRMSMCIVIVAFCIIRWSATRNIWRWASNCWRDTTSDNWTAWWRSWNVFILQAWAWRLLLRSRRGSQFCVQQFRLVFTRAKYQIDGYWLTFRSIDSHLAEVKLFWDSSRSGHFFFLHRRCWCLAN